MVSAASAALLLKNIVTKTHKGLHLKLQEEFIRTGEIEERIGKILVYGEDLRNRADYHTFSKIEKEQAENALADTEYFITKIEELIRTYLE